MKKTSDQKAANKWLNMPIIATVTRLLCRELPLQNEYLRQENKVLKSKINNLAGYHSFEKSRHIHIRRIARRDSSLVYTSHGHIIGCV